MSLQHRSSTERLTPEYRPPDRESSPLDYALDDVLPYDSFDDDSFVDGTPSDQSSHSAASSPSYMSETPDLDIIAAMDRSLADVELDLLLAQGEHQVTQQQIRDVGRDAEALHLCRRAADLEHRLEILTVQVRQLNQDGPGLGNPRENAGSGSAARPPGLLDEEVSFPVEDRELVARALDPELPDKLRQQLADMDVRIGRLDVGLEDTNTGASYMFSTVDRLFSIDPNVARAVNQLLDGLEPERLFQVEAEAQGPPDPDPTLQTLADELNVRTVEVERLEHGLERELTNRLRAAEVAALRHGPFGSGLFSRLRFPVGDLGAYWTPHERAQSEHNARMKVQWLQRQHDNLRRLRFEANTRPNLHPEATRSGPVSNVWPSFPFQPRLRPQSSSGSGAAATFRSRLEARADRNGVNSNRDAAVSLLLARYRRWQTRQAAENVPVPASSQPRGDGNVEAEPARGNDESEYENPFESSSPVRFVSEAPAQHPRNTGGGRDELVDVEIGLRGSGRRAARDASRGAPSQVVDLTEEPDSPAMASRDWPARLFPRHLRRHASAHGPTPPPLTRSDSSILGGANGSQVVIDLTEDDPEPPADHESRRLRERRRPVLPGSPELLFIDARPRTRSAAHRRQPLNGYAHQLRDIRGVEQQFETIRRTLAQRSGIFELLNPLFPGRVAAPFDPIGPVNLQYEYHAFNGRPPPPKPATEVPQPPRPGFTRDTDPETAFVCPGCNEELAYDPDDAPAGPAPTRSKSKRSRSEHHFWALKSCGHVYCADCFENRRPSAKRPKIFPTDAPSSTPVCCVEDCKNPVASKTNWVGIYM